MTMKSVLILFLMLVGCSHTRVRTIIPSAEPEISTKAVLGAGDVIDIRIFDEPELSGARQIGSDGFVRMPLIGLIKISGLNAEEASNAIAIEYQKKYLKNPDISVFVQQSNSRKVFLLGEVKSPGPYAYEENMTLIAAIAKAGGTTVQSAANRTLITRNQSGKQIRITAKVADIGQGESQDMPVYPGDIIFVPQSIF